MYMTPNTFYMLIILDPLCITFTNSITYQELYLT